MKFKGWIKGVSVLLSFIGSFLIVGELVATSSPDYKNLVDGVFGINYSASISGDISTFNYRSDFDNTISLVTKRSQIAEQLEEEGMVLLKNNNQTLPLRKEENQNLNVTVLGSRAFTFKDNATRTGLRDGYKDKPPIQDFREMNVYAGICGSRTYGATVTLEEKGLTNIPVTLLDALANENVNVNPASERAYCDKPFPNPPAGSEANGQAGGPFSIGEPSVNINEFGDYNNYKDAAIVMIGRMSGEGREYVPGQRGIENPADGSKSALNLSNEERNLITVAKGISDNVIVLLNSAIPMEIDELVNNDDVSSILWIGLPGSYGMNAVARILTGKANPSGSLPDIYAVDASASPAAVNFGAYSQDGQSFTWSNPGSNKDTSPVHAYDGHYVVLAEGIYDGYFYYETRYADTVMSRGNASDVKGAGRNNDGSWKYENEVIYSFGYGMSYTTFSSEIVDSRYNEEKAAFEVDVKVTNTGSVAGKKSVQLYLSSPYTSYDIDNGVEKSAIQLVGFEKTQEALEPGQEETLTVSVPLKYLASYDRNVTHDNNLKGGYILEDVLYYLSIGNGAHEALNNILVSQDEAYTSSIYKAFGVEADPNLVVSFNPALEESLKSDFKGGINATTLNKVSDDVYISNQLDTGDYNYYKKDTVTYLSRSNWKDTFPVPYPGLSIEKEMELPLGKGNNTGGHVYKFTSGSVDVDWGVDHTLDEDQEGNPLKQEVVVNFKNKEFDDENWDYLIEQITFKEALYFAPRGGSNCKPFTSINAPEVWQADGPNGNLTKSLGEKAASVGPMAMKKNDKNSSYKSCDMPCEPIIAGTFNKELVEQEGDSFGEMALWDNCKILWAPGMNLHRCPFNSRNHEYYSEDPMLTNIMGAYFVQGGLKKGALLSAKHFAFNTQETYREGLSQFMNEQAARELELRGFQGLFEDIHVETPSGTEVSSLALMSSFSRLGCTGVNAHTGLMVNILRKEWGFKGLISTDFVATGDFFNPQDCVANNVTFMACGNSDGFFSNIWKDYNTKTKADPFLNRALKQNMHYYLFAITNSSALNGFDASSKAIDSSKIVSSWQIGFIVGGSLSLFVAGGLFSLELFFYYKKKREEAQ